MPRLPSPALVILLGLGACISREKADPTSPDDPVLLFPAARTLIDDGPSRLITTVDPAGEAASLDTGLLRRVAERAKPAVVSVYTETREPIRIRLLPIPILGLALRATLPGEGLGSGFFVHEDGYVLTNDHVIRNAEKIAVMTQDDVAHVASVVARHPFVDLALLKVEVDGEPFPVLPMGDSDRAGAGDPVLALGNPLGLGHTVTFGIVSQTGRDLAGVPDDDGRQVRYLQTDTGINPGSSGGPLVTLDGAWIGVNTSILANAQSIAFSVPSRVAREFVEKVRRGDGVWPNAGP